ncbi:glycosyltransferase family 2 protein [Sphingomonas aracearum]|uniref:Glycosyltransferase n=1 Tax=Sphingomonas aracearum TaxID=2283317 RepID=A0A369VWS8_9SPHN|nr:glycosyltransferase family 2 protein [Sphingomonas aracearum]RDE06299.1 glycosyltransferase [Sphingomonas aracearum]
MDRELTVCCAVLTYNRRDLLARCLEAINAQTRACDQIVVIDNASTDGSAEMVAQTWGAQVTVVSLPNNIGAAGGFATAVKAARETGADFVWLMDDDVLPRNDALQHLLKAHGTLADQGVEPAYLISRSRALSGAITDVPDLDRRANRIGFPGWAAFLDAGLAPTLSATFVSILLPRDTIDRHGLPLADLYMWGEDREYTARITRDRPGFLVGASEVIHARAIEGQIDIRTERDPRRLRNHYYLVRNTTFITRRYERSRKLVYHLARQLSLLVQLSTRGRWRHSGIILRGLVEGLVFRPAPNPLPSSGPAKPAWSLPAATGLRAE